MQLRFPSFLGRAFYGLKDLPRFVATRDELLANLKADRGVFASDNLITWEKSLPFMLDEQFTAAVKRHAETNTEKAIVWRTAVLAWAVRNALRVEGDLVECGCYRGTTARIICDVIDLNSTGRQYYLYDLFDGAEGLAKHAMPDHGPDLEGLVRRRFADLPGVVITKGSVPDSFAVASPERISFLHIDMNNAEAEIAALEVLFDRVSPGGVVVLDDYGWLGYANQMLPERRWLMARGYHVLDLPTGQGLILR